MDFKTLIRDEFSDAVQLQSIEEALAIASEKLKDLTRYNGEPFVNHSINTALIVAREIGLGRSSVVAALLHDVARLELMALEEIEAKFGKSCVGILSGLCNISAIDPKVEHIQIENFKELLLSYSTDPRIIIIKLADRLEVMRSLEKFPAEKRIKKSWESLNMYAQIAHKLGLYSIKSELEDLSLKHIEPEAFNHIRQRLEETATERETFIKEFTAPIEDKLNSAGTKYTIKGRTKSIYSIWRKMRAAKVSFDEVFDLFAIRIVIDCEQEYEKQLCWGAYSIVTDFYHPNPERLRDWISIPKSNGYESLHTTVVTHGGKWVEVQIRTVRMDEVAEKGVAAHWRYKGVSQGAMNSEQWLETVREIIETTENDESVMENFNVKLSSKEIFVFTPNGDLRKLREGATVIDFAFDIHSSLGSTCTGAKVNMRNVTIKHVLKSGDVVEILTSKNQRPKPDWLHIAVTSKARSRIKAYLREVAAKSSDVGREELERKIKNWKLGITIEEAVTMLVKYYKVKTGLELYAMIGESKIDIADVKQIITAELNPQVTVPKEITIKERVDEAKGDSLIIDEKLSGIDYKFGRCCNPIFGDDVFGFVTVSAGITIHRNDCANARRLKEQYPYRVIAARWRAGGKTGSFRANLRIQAQESVGVLNKITELLNKELKLNISSINVTTAKGVFTGNIAVEVPNNSVLDMVIYHLMKIKEVEKVNKI